MTRSQKLLSLVLCAAVLLSVVPQTARAQQLTDAQAQALLQALAAQQSAGGTLTAAQNQMLLQYLLAKQTSAAALTGVSATQSQAQAQMLLRQVKAGTPGAASLMPQTAAAAVVPPAAAVLGEKKPGIVRLGIVMPKSQLAQSAQGPAAGEPLRVMLEQYLAGPSVEVVSIAALLPEQIEAEGKAKSCDYLVYSSISQKKASGGFGMLRNASSMANMIPMVGMMNGAGAAMGAAAAATSVAATAQAASLSTAVKAKGEVTLDYHLNATGNAAPLLTNSLKAKASADGEDVVTPLVEQEAAAIMTAVTKKK